MFEQKIEQMGQGDTAPRAPARSSVPLDGLLDFPSFIPFRRPPYPNALRQSQAVGLLNTQGWVDHRGGHGTSLTSTVT